MSNRNIQYYEYIVVGCGGIGSGAVYWLSKRVGSSKLCCKRYNRLSYVELFILVTLSYLY